MRRNHLFAFLALALAFTFVVPLTGCGSLTTTQAAPQTASPTEVKITLSDFSIQSSLTTFTKGTLYHFEVTNAGKAVHELMVVPTSTAHGTEEEIDQARLFEVDDVDVGQIKTLDYTFKDAATAGTLEFACHQPGHYEAGMRLDITVN